MDILNRVAKYITSNKFYTNVEQGMPKKSIAFRVSDFYKIDTPKIIQRGIIYENDEISYIDKQIETDIINVNFNDVTIEKYVDVAMKSGINGKTLEDVLDNIFITELTRAIDKKMILLFYQNNNMDNITLNDLNNKLDIANEIYYLINKSLNDLPKSETRSEKSFVVVNNKIGALLSLLNIFKNNFSEEMNPNHIGDINGLRVMICYDDTFNQNDDILIGIMGNDVTNGSIMSYFYKTYSDVVPSFDTGRLNFINKVRVGITLNPLNDRYKMTKILRITNL